MCVPLIALIVPCRNCDRQCLVLLASGVRVGAVSVGVGNGVVTIGVSCWPMVALRRCSGAAVVKNVVVLL